MKLNKFEEEIFENIKDGVSDTCQLKAFTQFSAEEIKEILIKLERLDLIALERKFDKYYNEDYWEARIK